MKPEPPQPPNYAQAAQQQGQANIDAAKAGSQINNPNVISPYGTQTYYTGSPNASVEDTRTALQKQISDIQAKMPVWESWDWRNANGLSSGPYASERAAQWFSNTTNQLNSQLAPLQQQLEELNRTGQIPTDPGRQTLVQQFSPEQQKLYDQMVRTQGLLGGLGEQGAKSLYGVVGKPVDFSGMPASPQAEQVYQRAVDAMMQRPLQDYGRRQDQLNSDLAAAGIPTTSKAYGAQHDILNRQLTDAQTQAGLAGVQAGQTFFGQDTAARAQAIAEYLAQRQVPLNEITALLSGSQVQNPFAVPGYAQNAQAAPSPYFNAANATGQYNTDLYNVNAAQQGQLMQGLFGLGGSGLMAAGLSDRRLKSNIQRIGMHRLGIGIYDYDLFGQRERGVMADELEQVKPEAVAIHPSGYKMVFYDLIGGRPV